VIDKENGQRLHPDFGVRDIRTSHGNAAYHAMQWRIERRFSRRFQGAVSYTWSRNIDSTSEGVAPSTSRRRVGTGRGFQSHRAGSNAIVAEAILTVLTLVTFLPLGDSWPVEWRLEACSWWMVPRRHHLVSIGCSLHRSQRFRSE